jgi:hypothetical protein
MSPLVLSVLALLSSAPEKPTPKEVFEKRILPIFKSPDPSSCVQCHLSGVDLKNYILPSSEQTFASLRDQGLIDLERPEKSKILALIRMGKEDKATARVHAKARDAEYEAFSDWIARGVADPKMRELPKLAAGKEAKSKRPVEVIRHARKDRVLESFTNNIWPMRFRCMNCHTEGETASKKLVEEHGERVAWFKAAGPEATLAYLRASKLLDVDAPEKSLLLRKPLNDVKHGGGKKFVVGDQGYTAFRAFLEDYARVVKDGYADADSLPKANGTLAFGSDIWLKLTNTPQAWGDKLLQVDVYAWDADRKAWGTAPVATSDRIVWGKGKLWQHNLTLLAAKGSPLAVALKKKAALPRGRYRVEIRVEKGVVGRVEVSSAWPEGYGKMTAVDASRVKE